MRLITAFKPTKSHQKPGGTLHMYSGGQRSSGHFDTKKDAVNRVCEISKNQETELLIHNKDGKTGSKDGHEK
ncbi:DUF2188 domain-containing protein [Pseudomonas sp. IT-P291]|uniref:DUF2188 domain-containing protein n=1 Tax=Pseudomonas sp. IT-P291 TaxID=3026448 RepID=UPI0039E1DF36